jgi:prolyl-tRNA synthetase
MNWCRYFATVAQYALAWYVFLGECLRLSSHCYRRRLWMGPGAKLKDAQLYGYPTIIVVGTHTQHDDNLFEVQDRSTGKSEVLHFNDLLHRLGR